jgi:hypothetical protein
LCYELLNHDGSLQWFTFIAVVATIASTVIIAAWPAWLPDGQLMQEVDKSSTGSLDKTNIVPLQNTSTDIESTEV